MMHARSICKLWALLCPSVLAASKCGIGTCLAEDVTSLLQVSSRVQPSGEPAQQMESEALQYAAREIDIYNANEEAGMPSTAAWVESVLGASRPWWKALVSGRGAPPASGTPPALHPKCTRPAEEVMHREPCSRRQATCHEAQQYLTTASCIPAAGYKGEHHQVCYFKNLYSSGDPKVPKLVAHVLQTSDSEFPIEHICNVRTIGLDTEPLVMIQYHSSLEAFADFVEGVPVLANLTLAFKPHWQNNIGHALYDSLYPAFVSLLQFGRHEASYRTLLLQEPIPGYYVDERLSNEGIFAVIGGSSKNSTHELHGLHRFEEVIVGNGPNSAEFDINVNLTLAAGRSLGAAGLFRDRIYRSFGLPPPLKRAVSSDGRTGDGLLQAILIDSAHMGIGGFAKDSVTLAASVGVNLTSLAWMDSVMFPTANGIYTAPGPDRFREQLRVLARSDIHISGPGTAMMYQQLLPDGSVVVNLGDATTGNTMDEYMAEGAPYLRAIYAVPHPGVTPAAAHIALLAKSARDVILAGFPTSGVTGASLSPSAAVIKAYAHLEYMQSFNNSIDPLTPLRALETFGCSPGCAATMATAMLLQAPCEEHKLRDIKLLRALQKDFDSWHNTSTWFNSSMILEAKQKRDGEAADAAAKKKTDEEAKKKAEDEAKPKDDVGQTTAEILWPSRYQGCYVDDAARMFKDTKTALDGSATALLCIAVCKDAGKPFFALQNGDQCSCGEAVPDEQSPYDKVPDDECGPEEEIMNGARRGKAWRNAVYKVGAADQEAKQRAFEESKKKAYEFAEAWHQSWS